MPSNTKRPRNPEEWKSATELKKLELNSAKMGTAAKAEKSTQKKKKTASNKKKSASKKPKNDEVSSGNVLTISKGKFHRLLTQIVSRPRVDYYDVAKPYTSQPRSKELVDWFGGAGLPALKTTPSVRLALQSAAEDYLIKQLGHGGMEAKHAKRVTLKDADISLLVQMSCNTVFTNTNYENGLKFERDMVKPAPRPGAAKRTGPAAEVELLHGSLKTLCKIVELTRVSGSSFPVIRILLKAYLVAISDVAMETTAEGKRKTISMADLDVALKRVTGQSAYGFDYVYPTAADRAAQLQARKDEKIAKRLAREAKRAQVSDVDPATQEEALRLTTQAKSLSEEAKRLREEAKQLKMGGGSTKPVVAKPKTPVAPKPKTPEYFQPIADDDTDKEQEETDVEEDATIPPTPVPATPPPAATGFFSGLLQTVGLGPKPSPPKDTVDLTETTQNNTVLNQIQKALNDRDFYITVLHSSEPQELEKWRQLLADSVDKTTKAFTLCGPVGHAKAAFNQSDTDNLEDQSPNSSVVVKESTNTRRVPPSLYNIAKGCTMVALTMNKNKLIGFVTYRTLHPWEATLKVNGVQLNSDPLDGDVMIDMFCFSKYGYTNDQKKNVAGLSTNLANYTFLEAMKSGRPKSFVIGIAQETYRVKSDKKGFTEDLNLALSPAAVNYWSGLGFQLVKFPYATRKNAPPKKKVTYDAIDAYYITYTKGDYEETSSDFVGALNRYNKDVAEKLKTTPFAPSVVNGVVDSTVDVLIKGVPAVVPHTRDGLTIPKKLVEEFEPFDNMIMHHNFTREEIESQSKAAIPSS